jgi:hypothetical protein
MVLIDAATERLLAAARGFGDDDVRQSSWPEEFVGMDPLEPMRSQREERRRRRGSSSSR